MCTGAGSPALSGAWAAARLAESPHGASPARSLPGVGYGASPARSPYAAAQSRGPHPAPGGLWEYYNVASPKAPAGLSGAGAAAMRAAYGATSAAYGAAQTGPSASARLGAARNAGTSPSGGLATAPLRGALSPAAPRSPLAAQRFAFAPGPSAHRAAAEAEIAQRGATVAHRNEAYERALEALRGREGGNEAPLVTPSTPYETHVRALATEALGLQFGALAHQEAASGAAKAQAAAQAAADGKENVIVRELVLPHEKHAARIRRGGADEGEEEGVGVVFAAAVVGLRWGDLVTVPALRRAGLPVVALADADAQLRDDAAQRHGVVEAVDSSDVKDATLLAQGPERLEVARFEVV